jgi:hypothetical protein
MEQKGPATFKYNSEGSTNAGIIGLLITSFIITFIAIMQFGPWYAWGMLLPVGIIIHLVRMGIRKNLIIAPRYLIVGEVIIYYSTVSKAQVDRHRQVLTLVSERGKRVLIEAERFPTNARKEFKVKANKKAKFDKAVEKILARLQGVTPEFIG